MKKLWFKNKTYGRGRVPASREGRLVTILYVVIMLLLGLTIDENSSPREVAFMFVLPILILTTSLLTIAYKTGEKPERRWGPKKDG